MTATPGLTLGPQNVDAAGELTKKLGVHNKADRLLKRHRELYPLALTQALARPIDGPRTATLDIDEVHSALSGLKGRSAFFDPDTDTLESATVRGDRESNRVVSVVFITKSGRSARGVIPYASLTGSVRAFKASTISRSGVAAMVVPGDGEPAWLPGGEPLRDDAPALAAGDADAALAERVAALEAAATSAEERARDAESKQADLESRLARAEDPEPWDGYDEENVDTVVQKLEDDGLKEFGRGGLERILTYESERKDRKGVKDAIDAALISDQPTSTD